jgi:hypothetical protein
MNMEGMPSASDGGRKESEAVVFQGKRMRERAEKMLTEGLSEAPWEGSDGKDTGLRLYVVPLVSVTDGYVSGFGKLLNYIRDENGEYGIFLGIRKSDFTDESAELSEGFSEDI